MRKHNQFDRSTTKTLLTGLFIGSSLFLPDAAATEFQWEGSSGELWGDDSNWIPSAVPNSPDDSAIFTIAGNANELVRLSGGLVAGPYTIENLTIQQGGPTDLGSFRFTGGTLEFATNDPSGQAQLNYESTGNTFESLASVELSDDTVFNGAADSDLTFAESSSIIGSAALIKQGEGELIMDNAGNSYSGGTEVNEGTLSVSSDTQLGGSSGNLSFDGGTLRTREDMSTSRDTTIDSGNGTIRTNNGTKLTHTGTISGNGTLTKTGNGSLILKGDNTYSGGTLLSSGTLVVGHENALGTSPLTIEAGTTLGSNNNFTVSNDFFVNGDFNIAPEGAPSTFTSTTFGTSGKVNLGGETRTITNSINLFDNHLAAALFSGVISNGGINFASSGVPGANEVYFYLEGSEANTYTGPTTIGSNVILKLRKDENVTAIAGDIFIDDNGSLTTNKSEQIASTANVHFSGNSRMTIGTGILLGEETIGSLSDDGSGDAEIDLGYSTLRVSSGEFSGTISGAPREPSLEKYGPGTLVLSGTNTYQGGTLVSGGTLQVSADENLGDASGELILDGGTLRTTESFTTDRETTLESGDGTFRTNNGTKLTHTGTISGDGALIKTGGGNLQLEGNNTYTGGTIIQNGAVRVSKDENLGNASGDLILEGGRLRVTDSFATTRTTRLRGSGGEISVRKGATLFHSGLLRGPGSLSKIGNGTLDLYSANTYKGGTVLDGGTLVARNAQSLGTGRLDLQSGNLTLPGNLNLGDDFNWSGGSINSILGTNTSLVNIDGSLNLTGIGEYEFTPDAGFSNNTDYLILTANDPITSATSSDFIANDLFGLTAQFKVVGDKLYVNYLGSVYAGGNVLQNSAPVGTPSFAEFIVAGEAHTGGPNESNTIRSLIFRPGGTLQVNNTLSMTDGRFSVDEGTGTLNGGLIFVPQTFNKTGGGSLVVNSDVNVQGATYVDQGSLYVNGSFFSGFGFNVGPNALLGGNGRLIGNLINNGTVAPGNSIGTLTVNGDYTQTSGGTLSMEIRNASVSDRINITGAAYLAGTLALDFISNEISFGDVVTLLTAQGGINGAFEQISGVPGGFRARPWTVGNNSVYNLIFAPSSYTQVAQGANQTALARALDQWIGVSDPQISSATLQLDLLSADAYPVVFESILPSIYGTLSATTFTDSYSDGRSVNQQALFGRQRLMALAAAEAAADETSPSEKAADESGATNAQPQPDDHGWRVWADARGLYSDDDPLNLDSKGGTVLAGADILLAENFLAGIYVGGQTRESRGSSPDYQSDGPRFGAYGLVTFLQNAYISAVVGGGTSDISATRPIAFGGSASGDTDGTDWFTRIESGYTFKPGGFQLTPFAGLQFSTADFDGLTESGESVYALEIEDWGSDRFEGYLGGDLSRPIPLSGQYVLQPYVRLTLRETFDQNDDSLNSSLLAGQGPSFAYTPDEINGDGFEYGGGIRLSAMQTGWNVNLGYTGFSGDDSTSNQINLGFSWDL
ncbi:autotransporter domain-containing protein [Puniceicoccus vermicola]|uniref:Autotransporter domain-containing protein n=1 Tax=Puniceicoccus vermicola TaxID=388746 RepID=A0A7X1AVT0_9BACT|nr:autotransporter domain-containing protein [Puniceicoccus vermicola]MBC2600809.1 autotransporter domain-containing protein [Puniceicoccus vermicola]